jgi:hypothetical protein
MNLARWIPTVILMVCAAQLSALGAAEDPDEHLTKTIHVDSMRTLEVRGQIDFEIVPSTGKDVEITVETTRALFDQLNISNWWGWGTVAIESGLMGPRERGAVKVKIALPSLELLTIVDHSHGTGTWPGTNGRIVATEFSSAELGFTGTSLHVEATWFSAVTLKGKTDSLDGELKFSSHLDAGGFTVGKNDLATDKTSEVKTDAN